MNKVKKLFKVNPIVRKDLKVISRSMKFSWGLFAYEAILAIIFLFIMLAVYESNRYGSKSNTDIYEGYIAFFHIIGIAQLCMISLIVPIITASSISGERERQTMDVMLTTTISPYSIVIGKITSAVFRVMTFIIASVPLMAVSFMMGGMKWRTLFEYLVLALIFAIFTGSIGTFCSSVFKKSIPAIIISYVIYGVIYGVTYTPLFIAAIMANDIDDVIYVLLFDLINPVHTFLMFFYDRISGEDFISSISYNSNYSSFTEWLFSTNVWLVLSSIVQLGVAAFFIWLAARRLRPAKK